MPDRNSYYRGRVRSGCLTCRAKKVKCDERRPSCQRCVRLDRTCSYKVKIIPLPSTKLGPEVIRSSAESLQSHELIEVPVGRTSNLGNARFAAAEHSASCNEPIHRPGKLHNTGIEDDASAQAPETTTMTFAVTELADDRNSSTCQLTQLPSHYMMTSQDIYLCTTIDLLAAKHMQAQPSFAYFLENVNPPLRAPFVTVDWSKMKAHFVGLATDDMTITITILAVQALSKAQSHGLPTSHATGFYRAARSRLDVHFQEDNVLQDFVTILAALMLLALFETLEGIETGSILSQSDEPFVRSLRAWSHTQQQHGIHSHVATRIIAYLRILHVATRRCGSAGLLSSTVIGLLPYHYTEEIGRDLSQAHRINQFLDSSSTSLLSSDDHEYVSDQVFTFFYNIQNMSIRSSDSSHYHRSRTTVADQAEVSAELSNLKSQMEQFWNSPPRLMHLQTHELRAQLGPAVVEPLITLIGVCSAAYWGELVDLGRNLSDPPLAGPEAKHAMRKICEIVDGDWKVRTNGKLNSSYIRPLVLCAIESIHLAGTQWAVDRFLEIKDPIGRSDFFANLCEGPGGSAEGQRASRNLSVVLLPVIWGCATAYMVYHLR